MPPAAINTGVDRSGHEGQSTALPTTTTGMSQGN